MYIVNMTIDEINLKKPGCLSLFCTATTFITDDDVEHETFSLENGKFYNNQRIKLHAKCVGPVTVNSWSTWQVLSPIKITTPNGHKTIQVGDRISIQVDNIEANPCLSNGKYTRDLFFYPQYTLLGVIPSQPLPIKQHEITTV